MVLKFDSLRPNSYSEWLLPKIGSKIRVESWELRVESVCLLMLADKACRRDSDAVCCPLSRCDCDDDHRGYSFLLFCFCQRVYPPSSRHGNPGVGVNNLRDRGAISPPPSGKCWENIWLKPEIQQEQGQQSFLANGTTLTHDYQHLPLGYIAWNTVY